MNPGHHQHHQHKLFSSKRAAHLDTILRHIIYRPDSLAARYVQQGDHVLDFGCGPGFFTRAFAKKAGKTGKVWAVDLQKEMLDIVREKMTADGLMDRVALHQCLPDSIALPSELEGTIDMAFAIFVIHEVPDPAKLFQEIATLLKPGGLLFYTEPPLEVSGKEYRENLLLAEEAGFWQIERFHYFVNRATVFRHISRQH
jgi:ubiquinone/menaquinone biosynthesis C-methylase UbiE